MIEGVIIKDFIDIYCAPIFREIFNYSPQTKNYVENMRGMAEVEKIVIGRPVEEPEYIQIGKRT